MSDRMPDASSNDDSLDFCTRCFATNEDGSWGCTVVGDGAYCTNCGANGFAVKLPRWAIESIRKTASWVGKRYYPCDEDRDDALEREQLRALVKVFPGRVVEPAHEPGWWSVKQDLGGGRMISILVEAANEEQAFEKGRTRLPYYNGSQAKPKPEGG